MKVHELKVGDKFVASRNLWPEMIIGSKKRPPVLRGDVVTIEKIYQGSISTQIVEIRFEHAQIVISLLASHPDYEISDLELWVTSSLIG